MAQVPEQIASLLIPMIGRPLLIPNVAVAEIVSWENSLLQLNDHVDHACSADRLCMLRSLLVRAP